MNKITLFLAITSLLAVSPALYCASSSSSSSSTPRTWSSKEISEFLDNHTKANPTIKKKIIDTLGSQVSSLTMSPNDQELAVLKHEDTGVRIFIYNLESAELTPGVTVNPSTNQIKWISTTKLYGYSNNKPTALISYEFGRPLDISYTIPKQ